MKRPVSIRDKFASKRKRKRVFRRLASCERRALYLRCASRGKISSLPAFWAKFHFRLPFEVKFTAAISFDEILPSLDFP
ncbi:hypothetical protein [uncultured Campylobacter sp.]|uniref:hypothetical protein n=1 Tax=uncultured Campylobacter sp. TaxID=218934 RepID=UPI00261B7898|nr:hypothetical protein [uncultured Campylobacter sp.]